MSGMRKVIYSMMVSLDGYIETLDGSLAWHVIDRELHEFVNHQQASLGGYLWGRQMYENMAAFWPTADADPSQPDFVAEYAQIWREIPKVIFSKTLKEVAWNSRLAQGELAEEVAALKAQPGNDLAVAGADLAASFLRLGLIDEVAPFIHPVILGSGRPFLPPSMELSKLRLLETHTFGSGVVYLHYAML
jgi:dihydrofolate reductase